MPLRRAFVIARAVGGRPTLQHRCDPDTTDRTACGQDMSRWSRSVSLKAIPEVLCKKARCRA